MASSAATRSDVWAPMAPTGRQCVSSDGAPLTAPFCHRPTSAVQRLRRRCGQVASAITLPGADAPASAAAAYAVEAAAFDRVGDVAILRCDGRMRVTMIWQTVVVPGGPTWTST